MKRDMDLIRKILLNIEGQPSGWAPNTLTIDDYDENQVDYHVLIMIEAGLLVGFETNTMSSPSPAGVSRRMTWEGHDFLDACRDETRWNKAKSIVGKIGGASIEVLKQVLTDVMVGQVRSLIS